MNVAPLRHLLPLIAGACVAISASTARSQTREPAPFVLLDQTLHENVIDLTGIRGEDLVYRDEAGRTQTVRLANTAALLPAWWSPRSKPTDAFSSSVAPIKKAAPSFGVIELVDGQRLGVRLSPDASPDPDAIFWESSLFGRLAVKLDSVRRVRVGSTPSAPVGDDSSPGTTRPSLPIFPADPKSDIVVLLNGDRLTGFVERIGPTIAIESGGTLIETPSKQVAEVRLVNPARPPSGSRLWLTDGTVVDVARFLSDGAPAASAAPSTMVRVELNAESWTRALRPTSGGATNPSAATEASPNEKDAGKLSSKPSAAPVKKTAPGDAPNGSVKLSQLGALAPNVRNLVSLASRPILRQQASAGRPPIPSSEPVQLSWAGVALDVSTGGTALAFATPSPVNGQPADASVSPPLDAADIELPGPMLAEWAVPAGASRLAGWAELPRECWTWGHCVIVLSLIPSDTAAAPIELFRHTLAVDSPIGEFNVELPRAASASAPLTLRATLEAGERGPIQDRVLLRRVLFLCEPPATRK